MKYFLLLLISTNLQAQDILPLLDSIDNYPSLYTATLYRPDSTIHRVKTVAHHFEGFKREGVDAFGRQHILLYNRVYDCKYGYVVNGKPRDNIDSLKSANIKSITIITDKPGVWISHWGCEYLIIIHTK